LAESRACRPCQPRGYHGLLVLKTAGEHDVLNEEVEAAGKPPLKLSGETPFGLSGAAQESNLPTHGLHAPAGFEDCSDLALGAGLQVVSDHLSDHRRSHGVAVSSSAA
jgi:hypothetical protein